VRISELLELVRSHARIPVRHELDQNRLRPHEVMEIRGSAGRFEAACGWQPEIPLTQTVGDALDHWREQLGASAG
jgi:GDP-4-dehydro-6-deoxy-D-mannose reductase